MPTSSGIPANSQPARKFRAGLLFLLICGANGLYAADELTVSLEGKEVLEKRLEAGVVPLKQRQAAIQDLFEQAGCTPSEQPVSKKIANVICALPGQTNATIIVGAHYDYADEGQGIVDDWSGAAMLASLYHALKGTPRKYAFQFVAFGAEEEGLVGSRRFVKAMTRDDLDNARGFVNLECLGLTPPKVWASRSTPSLLTRLMETSNSIHIPVQGVNVDKVGDDDSHPFLKRKVPVITIHSVTADTWPILHSKRDNLDAIQMDDYQASYRLVAFYLAYLDVKLL